MRIIIITSSTNRSGGTRQALYQAEALDQRGHEVTLCLPAQSSFWELPGSRENPLWCPLPEDRSHWRKAVESMLPAHGPAVVHAFHNKAVKQLAWWGLFWMKKGIACVAHRGVIFRPGNPLPYLSPGMRAVLPNSAACARALRLHCPAHKLHIVQNGVPDVRVTPTISQEHVRALFPLHEPFLFGCVANDTPVKGAERLIRAFAVARQQGLRAELLFVGPTKERFLPIAESLGIGSAIHFAGKVENVADYLQICHAFAFPSVGMDSAPNTLIEALRMGLPVVANAVGGVAEIAVDCGLLVRPGDDKALADALYSMANNSTLRERCAANSRTHGSFYSMTARCEALEAIYENELDKLNK